ncbi:unnamed protein product [Albugo candida]|uniref:E1 ubiquitin-activating enzyme n=1 Tax=Albugo candida TaxID=65357 RepID=A0A024FZA0_9STRA|nr:unnamed protein product [Albugo candida]|eukprot:CCI39648.1 unnamed protein product [Albugo candida]
MSVSNGDISKTADGLRTLVNVTENTADASKIDEGLYSRQLYVMGREAQLKMGSARILIIGLDGIGVEIAKNIILAGVKSVTVHDDIKASSMDLAAQFYLNKESFGVSRAYACVNKLAELNPYVKVDAHSGEITEEVLSQYHVVILVNVDLKKACRINEFCHANSIAFLSTEGRGVFGSVFCDFGDTFTVTDKDGKQPSSCMISSILGSDPPLVTVNDDERHQLETGDYVTFREIVGLDFLNACEPRKVTVTGPFTFTLDILDEKDKERFVSSSYVRGGYVTQVKHPVLMNFNQLTKALQSPGEFLITDFAKLNRSELLHIGFQALHAFEETYKKLPEPGNLQDAEAMYSIAVAMNSQAMQEKRFSVEHLETTESKKVLVALALGARGVISPMAAFLGGIVGQEALKACSGKFTPIHQFLYFDAVESLPEETYSGDASNYLLDGSRYDGQIAVFGHAMQKRLQNLNMFLVGAGAIGCEMLKNWAMMGLSTSDSATIHVTDMDTIEKSNLNRQFLFRSKDVQQPKAQVAGMAVKVMNPEINVKTHIARVGPETEDLFSDEFFESLSGVCTALDNVQARLYMDQRCLFYELPMLESGTLGTQANTQIVVPHKTENYGASRDPPEKSIPICTLKNFPNAIEHTLQWARDWFEGEFNQSAVNANQYLDVSDYVKQLDAQQNTKLETLEGLRSTLVTDRPKCFEDCISWARFKFAEMFTNQIKQLLHNFPLDQLTTGGAPFWSGTKRPPTPIEFDINEPLHLDFIISVATSRAKMYGVKADFAAPQFIEALSQVHVPQFVPRDGLKIAASDAELNDENNGRRSGDLDEQCQSILQDIPQPASLDGYRLAPIDFDKDDDDHMRVIVATSNLRARCYRIPEADMYKSRLIAGKIIPAIATTTALVTGLVCFELYKIIQAKPLEAYKNGFINLALPLFAFSEPVAPKTNITRVKGNEYKWTSWDRIEFDGKNTTLKEFIQHFESEYGAEVTMVSYGVTILYAMYSAKSRSSERMSSPVPKLAEIVTKKKLSPKQKYLILEICATDADGEDVDLPYIRYRLK